MGCLCTPAWCVNPDSPEVRKLIDDGKNYLEENTDPRLGGKCLIALVFLKDGAPRSHPRIQEALKACQELDAEGIRSKDTYSNGLAIIFLAELENGKNRDLLQRYAGVLASRQKPNGAWGYKTSRAGDTSQTQYAALSYWELLQVGLPPRVEAVEACANWLLKTQDPSGAWGYQGKVAENDELMNQREVSLSMMAAGMGGTLIFGNMLGLITPGQGQVEQGNESTVPAALKRTDVKKKVKVLSGTGVDKAKYLEAVSRAQKWYDKNFSAAEIKAWSHHDCYLLYSLERYKSFEEYLMNEVNEEPEWYRIGFQYLKQTQLPHGGWHEESRDPCATAFAVLFLLRSTQKSIRANLGQGTLVGGRGLSADLSRMKIRGGKLVQEHKPTEVDKILEMLEGSGSEDLDSLLSDTSALQVNNVGPDEARRLQQIIQSGSPEARLLATRALARLRDLDYVPSLLFAMTDPDKRVVREARDGLRYVSRRFGGFGLPDNFTDSQRYNALDKWKTWYLRLRPDAVILP